MTRAEIEEFLKAIEFRLGLFNQQLSHEDWIEVRHMFEKRSHRDLTWSTKYIRKLHAYCDHLEKVVASLADPSAALRSKSGTPAMRVVRGVEMEPPQPTDDLPKTEHAMSDAYDLQGYEP